MVRKEFVEIWNRYEKACERLEKLEKPLYDLREELECASSDNIDELCAKSEELLREYYEVCEEIQVTEVAGNFTNVIDFYLLSVENKKMSNLIKMLADEKLRREEVIAIARMFTKGMLR